MPVNPIIFQKASSHPEPGVMAPVIIYTRCPLAHIRDYILEEAGQIKYELPFLNAVSVQIPVHTARRLASHSNIALIDDDARVTKLAWGRRRREGEASGSRRPAGAAQPADSALGAPDPSQGKAGSSQNAAHSSQSAAGSSQNAAHSSQGAAGPAQGTADPAQRAPDAIRPGSQENHLAKDNEYVSFSAVGVAILDTGVCGHHDLIRPYNKIIGFKDFINGREEAYDDDGHGTHIAGIISGNGYVSLHRREKGRPVHMGVAPMSNIIAVKVLDEKGSGNVSDILAGLQWVIDNRLKYNIKVINISLGMSVEGAARSADPLARGAAAAVARGICVVAAAGNSGPGQKTINSPGISPHVITVAAADTRKADSVKDCIIANFSSRGPTIQGFAKPDVSAPGVEISSLSCLSPTAYHAESGTSMATPMVSGAAALLYERNPDLTPAQVKRILTYSAVSLHNQSRFAQGAGMINIERALSLL